MLEIQGKQTVVFVLWVFIAFGKWIFIVFSFFFFIDLTWVDALYSSDNIEMGYSFSVSVLTLYLIETPFNAFENRADPDKSCLIMVYSICI